ncbi:hypothetical protein PVAP13_5NG203681 [Panicum virgatum]|uniref:TFIIS N-terminal domain-containing protein n=1 Tax=Panicum virgatum TaxID=38727 RepID=A0A8T0RPD2_PANVG|nr:hypothetical protein PVAP13_5NG203681 [Panicum virgatum]
MAGKSPLRRWKCLFPAFGAIDATIESALGCSRDRYRRAMVEALQTLRLVPVTPAMLTSTDVAEAVAGLRGHESGRVCGLARRVLDGWRASVEGDLARARAALETLSGIPQEGESEMAAAAPPSAGDAHGGREPVVLVVENAKRAAMVPGPERPKKMPPGVCGAGGDRDRVSGAKTGDPKRRHPGGYYQEAEDVKRRRKDPEMVEKRSTKEHPTMKEKS